jgi:hypothetical protein
VSNASVLTDPHDGLNKLIVNVLSAIGVSEELILELLDELVISLVEILEEELLSSLESTLEDIAVLAGAPLLVIAFELQATKSNALASNKTFDNFI